MARELPFNTLAGSGRNCIYITLASQLLELLRGQRQSLPLNLCAAGRICARRNVDAVGKKRGHKSAEADARSTGRRFPDSHFAILHAEPAGGALDGRSRHISSSRHKRMVPIRALGWSRAGLDAGQPGRAWVAGLLGLAGGLTDLQPLEEWPLLPVKGDRLRALSESSLVNTFPPPPLLKSRSYDASCHVRQRLHSVCSLKSPCCKCSSRVTARALVH